MNAKTKIANCAVLPSESGDSAGFIRKLTPFQTKKQEIENDPQYQDGAIDKRRERSTAAKRKSNSVRQL